MQPEKSTHQEESRVGAGHAAGHLVLSGRKVGEQSAYVLAAQVVGLACALLSNFLVAWMLGPEGKGSVYLVQIIVAAGGILLNCGLGPAAIYYLEKEKSHSPSTIRSSVLWCSWVLGLLPLLACALVWPWLRAGVAGKLSTLLLLTSLAGIPAAVLMWNASYLSLARGAITSFNLLRTAPSLLFLALVAGLIALRYSGVAGVALCWLAANYAPLAFVSTGGHDAENLGWAKRLVFLKSAFRFGLRSHLGAVTQYLQHRVDVLIVGYFCSLRDVGIYSLAVTMAELLWYLPNTVANVLIPHVARSSDEDASRLTSVLCRAIVAVTTTLSVAMAALGAWVIPIILPAFKPSIHVLWLLLPGAVCCSIFKVLSSDLNGRGRPLETFHPAAMALGFCLFAGLTLTPRFGIMGAAVVTSAGYLLNTVLYLRAYKRITNVPTSELLVLRWRDVRRIQSAWKELPIWQN